MGERTQEAEKETRMYPPIHPGEMLKEEFLDPMGVTVHRLAKDTGVDRMRVHEIVHGKRGVHALLAAVEGDNPAAARCLVGHGFKPLGREAGAELLFALDPRLGRA